MIFRFFHRSVFISIYGFSQAILIKLNQSRNFFHVVHDLMLVLIFLCVIHIQFCHVN